MNAFIVNPVSYDKKTVLAEAVLYVEAFLDLNGIEHVKEYLWEPDNAKKPPGKNPWHDKGFYWNGNLFVNVKRSRVPVKVPGFQWSFTGYKADLTAPGVLAHETGHHVHFELEKVHTNSVNVAIERVRFDEPEVSGYEPNRFEFWAEAMRLFILNPMLLKEGRPKRYAMLTGLGLKPPHQEPWREVLKHAHSKLIAAAEKWVDKR